MLVETKSYDDYLGRMSDVQFNVDSVSCGEVEIGDFERCTKRIPTLQTLILEDTRAGVTTNIDLSGVELRGIFRFRLPEGRIYKYVLKGNFSDVEGRFKTAKKLIDVNVKTDLLPRVVKKSAEQAIEFINMPDDGWDLYLERDNDSNDSLKINIDDDGKYKYHQADLGIRRYGFLKGKSEGMGGFTRIRFNFKVPDGPFNLFVVDLSEIDIDLPYLEVIFDDTSDNVIKNVEFTLYKDSLGNNQVKNPLNTGSDGVYRDYFNNIALSTNETYYLSWKREGYKLPVKLLPIPLSDDSMHIRQALLKFDEEWEDKQIPDWAQEEEEKEEEGEGGEGGEGGGGTAGLVDEDIKAIFKDRGYVYGHTVLAFRGLVQGVLQFLPLILIFGFIVLILKIRRSKNG